MRRIGRNNRQSQLRRLNPEGIAEGNPAPTKDSHV
jgi:hypothetical protein